MKKILFVLTLGLAAAAGGRAQQKGVEYRTDDGFRGPVKSARIEEALFSKVDGVLVEGPRRLAVAVSYSPDGKRKEYEGYAPDGSLRDKFVYAYDDGGNLLEQWNYDGQNRLLNRFVYRREEGEVLTYNGDGTLRQRVQSVWNERHDQLLVTTYDGSGALIRRRVNTREGGKSVWKIYGADGSLIMIDESVHSLDGGGAHRDEEFKYSPDGSVASRRVLTSDASMSNLQTVEEDKNGTPRKKTRETREYDSHRNLLKLTTYTWDDAARDFVPFAVSY